MDCARALLLEVASQVTLPGLRSLVLLPHDLGYAIDFCQFNFILNLPLLTHQIQAFCTAKKILCRIISILLFATTSFSLPSHLLRPLLKNNFPIDVLGYVLPFIFLVAVLVQSFGVQFYILVIAKFFFLSFGNFLLDGVDLFKHFQIAKGYFGVLAMSRFLVSAMNAILIVAW